MKSRLLLVAGILFFVSIFSSCYWHHHHNVSISINDDVDIYQLSARFDEDKTRAVDNYIKTCTETNSRFSYAGNGNLEGVLILDDNTKVYVKSREGRLKIKFNKEENSEEAYEKVKDMCEGIKELLAKN